MIAFNATAAAAFSHISKHEFGYLRRWITASTEAWSASVSAKNSTSKNVEIRLPTYQNVLGNHPNPLGRQRGWPHDAANFSAGMFMTKAVILAAALAIGLAACGAPAKPMAQDLGPYNTATGRGDGWGGNPPGL